MSSATAKLGVAVSVLVVVYVVFLTFSGVGYQRQDTAAIARRLTELHRLVEHLSGDVAAVRHFSEHATQAPSYLGKLDSLQTELREVKSCCRQRGLHCRRRGVSPLPTAPKATRFGGPSHAGSETDRG